MTTPVGEDLQKKSSHPTKQPQQPMTEQAEPQGDSINKAISEKETELLAAHSLPDQQMSETCPEP